MSDAHVDVAEFRPKTSAAQLRLEIARRAVDRYEQVRRWRSLVLWTGLILSLLQCAFAEWAPAAGGLLIDGATVWGIPLLASFFAASAVWSSRLHCEQALKQYVAYMRNLR